MKKKSSKILLIIVCSLLFLTVLADLLVSNYMVGYALRPSSAVGNKDLSGEIKWMKEYYHTWDWFEDLRERGLMKDTTILDYRGETKIQGYFCPAEPASKRTAVIMHGYASSPLSMTHIARMFRDSLGFNVVLPGQYAHRLSEGEAIQMGWLDRFNLEKWSAMAHDIFADTLQVYHGISMGGATVMMASGDDLPEYVRGIIEDCGYTTVWEQFTLSLRQMHLPMVVLWTADKITRLRYGWGYKEASSLKQLEKSTLPMRFIHGDTDDFVPTEMVYRNYEAKKQGYKEIWLGENAAHGESYMKNSAKYTQKVREFLTEHVY